MKKEDIRVAVLCTSRCDTGCQHCFCNSGKNGDDLSLDAIRALKRSIKKFKGMATVCFTGGGEPLMWQHLPKAISILRTLPNVRFAMVTSGCLDKKDERLTVLKEVFKVEKKIMFNHSFNSFSPSFHQRLAFTLPYILTKGRYVETHVKLVANFEQDSEDKDEYRLYFSETFDLFERALKEAIGYCSRQVYLTDDNLFNFEKVKAVLKQENPTYIDAWLKFQAFTAQTVYRPYNLFFRQRIITTSLSTPALLGRAAKFSSLKTASYNYSLGLCCSASTSGLNLSPQGKFLLCCHQPNFPPIFLGKPGDDLGKMLKIKRHLFLKNLNLPGQLISGTKNIFDPCANCIDKAWEFYSKSG